MRFGKNLLAGLASSVWSALVGLLVVPYYLKYLGIEAYGLIGFFVTTQSLLQLLDFGLAPTINREVARCSADNNLREAGKLLHTLAVIYWGMAAVIVTVLVFLSPLIARYWLQSKDIPLVDVEHVLMLIGLVIALRWPVGLYQGAVMGAQRLTVSSSISIAMVTLGSIGAIGVLRFFSPTIQAFFVWQAVIALVYVVVTRQAAWYVVGRDRAARFDVSRLKRIWRFSAGMSGVAVSTIILMQLDKVLLSKILNLADFGRYMLAGTLAGGLYVLLTPVFNATYPRMSVLVALGDEDRLRELYRGGTRLLLAVLFPVAIAAIVFSNQLIALWTGNVDVASKVAPVFSLFLIGTALNGVMHFPYALQLAYGMTRLPLTINIVLMVVLVPTTIFLSLSYGAIGGAGAWAILNAVYVLLGTWLTHRLLLKGVAIKWLTADVGLPLFISVLVVGLAGHAINDSVASAYAKLAFGAGLVILASAIVIMLSRNVMVHIRRELADKHEKREFEVGTPS